MSSNLTLSNPSTDELINQTRRNRYFAQMARVNLSDRMARKIDSIKKIKGIHRYVESENFTQKLA
jgi:hypothetical protein